MTVPDTEREQKLWLAERAREVLESVPVKAGDEVVDFGCGAGTYAIPAAELVGESGIVHAIDCDADRMEDVTKARIDCLRAILGDGTTEIPLADGSCDVGLLYDVLQKLDDRASVIAEMHRVIRPGGVLSVYPMHLDADEITREVTGEGFRLRDDYAGLVLHFVRE